jgi:valyl-tRNA synthetase
MSKSAGNGIDPIEMIDKYGADAVRYSLVLLTKEGQDVKLAPERFEDGFRFANKVWNATRFVLLNMQGERSEKPERLEDRWILSRLERTKHDVTQAFEEYRLNDAAKRLYQFVWNDFCDWYVELVKPRLTSASDPSAPAARGTLARVIADTLALLHPFTPYITEVLWRSLHETLGEAHGLLIRASWPQESPRALDQRAEDEMQVIMDAVVAVRQIRNLTTLGDRTPLAAVIRAPRESERGVLQQHEATLRALAFIERPEIGADPERPPHSACGVVGGVEIFVPLPESVDRVKLKDVLHKRVEKLRAGHKALEAKLANPAFKAGAEDVWLEEQRRWNEMGIELGLLERNLAGF